MTRLTRRGERALRGAFFLNAGVFVLLAFGCAGAMDYAGQTGQAFDESLWLWLLIPAGVGWLLLKVDRHFH